MSERLDALTSWSSDWAGLRVAVLGLGMTGFSVADTLAELGSEVLVLAGAHDEDRERILEVLGVPVVVREPLDAVPDELVAFDPELVVASPGFPPHHPLLRWAAERGLPVWGDVELAWRVRDKTGTPAEWLCITGTNGKTTTTQLTAHMIAASGARVAPCGNIGVPVLDAVRDPAGFDVLVVELSSYQLHSTHSLAPLASVVLNIADDHLDWHGSAEAYRTAKGRVYERTRVACVYNRADDVTRELVEAADVQEGCRAIGFGLDVPGPSDFGVVDGILVDRAFLDDRAHRALELTTLEELRTLGLGAGHLVQDVLAAAALARAAGVEPIDVRRALADFRVDRHRNEPVGARDGVAWVDDSKATNPHAANASLHAYPSVVWIVGGLLKGVDIAPLVARHAERVRGAVVIGRDRAAVVEAFRQHAPAVPVFEVDVEDTEDVMPRAVAEARRIAETGDTVLLAPAAASMDQFDSYGDRGDRFASAVRAQWEASDDDPHDVDRSSDGAGDA
ncbi:UDP-N-acetylmuramoyl-L-alanine--D-glutamate ligase [Pseudoclavibacter chungangensis]|uniref:UDP-N-acetylmuramoylalanine--D-glutamate ligase n=1 Tax=Pseudoclavibacter chungangensis TaxID=587635 RepID=A0A7J5C000_9MICO|nr:UDP-N-acetylmuramoyl-L-alanine--D-glutamate ligase [Pseudoclavibacter chungangensis]KAB1660106.1 UDP-N-acetylmuramoyl-L-alanine--D-glutamate ligase [Pseudoclavibacter chungangensis]NYJ66789.1 UDP-N-acetylmuramoylalanine--D-glutamate ligase [Pseudoclavibacter chungangensis]